MSTEKTESLKPVVMPLQPIREGRFIANKVVAWLLENGSKDMNDIASQVFPVEHRRQFAQLIGYSVSGYGSLSYCNDESYDTTVLVAETGKEELEARNEVLREKLKTIKEGLKVVASAAFEKHPADFDCEE